MSIPVVWLSYRKPEIISRGYWDQGVLERLFNHTLWRPYGAYKYEHFDGFEELGEARGAVVVLPAQHHVDYIERLNNDIADLDWCLLILAGDECSIFPWQEVKHPNLKLWIMTPRPQLHADSGARFIGAGWREDTPDILAACTDGSAGRSMDWFFAGQITHERRQQFAEVFRGLSGGELIATPGFTQGLDREEYLRRMTEAKVVPCPAGPGTPDTFRLFEALEAGCVPLADATNPEGWVGYWDLVFGDVPFPIVSDWSDAPAILKQALREWPDNGIRCSAWWQNYKRQLAYDLNEDVRTLSGEVVLSPPHESITVLVPTSPIPSHPDTTIIEETLGSLRSQPDLANAEIIVMVDGVREEQQDRLGDYTEYVKRLVALCGRWHNVVPLVSEEHLHQAMLTKWALGMVRTPTILFVEHDTPVVGVIPWGGMVEAIVSDRADVIRLHHEASILAPHRYLMVDAKPRHECDVPMSRTVQWSQRPHLASTDFYRWMISTYFGDQSRTMIEDVMYGVVETHWREMGVRGWEKFRLWLYNPGGDIKRSTHLDGRGDDPKFSMKIAYNGDTPEFAPFPRDL